MDQSVGQIFQGIVEGSQKLVAEKVDAAGKRPKIKVIVGGAPVAEDFARSIGADGYAPDSMWNFKGPFGIIEHGRPAAELEPLAGYPVDRALPERMLESRVSQQGRNKGCHGSLTSPRIKGA